MCAQTFQVSGMTCDHCVAAVSDELRELAGVDDVVINLVSGGATSVTVTSDAPLDVEDVRAAVYEAGYELVT